MEHHDKRRQQRQNMNQCDESGSAQIPERSDHAVVERIHINPCLTAHGVGDGVGFNVASLSQRDMREDVRTADGVYAGKGEKDESENNQDKAERFFITHKAKLPV
jgi:hypothetical protein